MYMDDIKLFAKSEKELETLIQTIKIYSQDIGMEFVIEKCDMLITRSRKRQIVEGKKTTKPRKNQNAQRKRNKYLGILKVDTISQNTEKIPDDLLSFSLHWKTIS